MEEEEDMMDERDNLLDAIHLQYVYNNEEEDGTMKVETEKVTTSDQPHIWLYKNEKKKLPPIPEIEGVSLQRECMTCHTIYFKHAPKNIFGGFCFNCDCDKAFPEGARLSRLQKVELK